tara:strand:+ start:678 stop:791 length:114 start_codon:yes stop_codon:yes gene_type:complete
VAEGDAAGRRYLLGVAAGKVHAPGGHTEERYALGVAA